MGVINFLSETISGVSSSLFKSYRLPSVEEINSQLVSLENVESVFACSDPSDLLYEYKQNTECLAKESFRRSVGAGATIEQREQDREYLFIWSFLLACAVVFACLILSGRGKDAQLESLVVVIPIIIALLAFTVCTLYFSFKLSKLEYTCMLLSRGGFLVNKSLQSDSVVLRTSYVFIAILLFAASSFLVILITLTLLGVGLSLLPLGWSERLSMFLGGAEDGGLKAYMFLFVICLAVLTFVAFSVVILRHKLGFTNSSIILGNLQLCDEKNIVIADDICELTSNDLLDAFRRAAFFSPFQPIHATRFKKEALIIHGKVGEKNHRIDVIQLPDKEGHERWRNDRIRIINSPSLPIEEIKERLGDAYGFLAIIDKW